jgi:hypothetical protein
VIVLRQFDVKVERALNGNVFFIRAFPAFVSANLSGEVMSLIVPLIGSLVPALNGAAKGADASIMDIDLEAAAPALANGLSGLNGDKLEAMLKKLLVKHRNISVQLKGEDEAQDLTEDLANEVFCGDAQDMFLLAVDVIRANYTGFFQKLGDPFGAATKAMRAKG